MSIFAGRPVSPTLRCALLAAGAVLAGCRERAVPVAAAVARPDSARCAALRPADSLATSRTGFLEEVLDPRPTARTPRFDDYHAGSYHVAKEDVATGLAELARACGLPLSAAVVLGPVGPLWAYHVVAFLQEPDRRVRVNALVMPHARITGKSTGLLAAATADSLLSALVASPLLAPGAAPVAAPRDTGALARDFVYDLLLLRVDGDSALLKSGSLQAVTDSAAADQLVGLVNALLGGLRPTYPDSATRRRLVGDT